MGKLAAFGRGGGADLLNQKMSDLGKFISARQKAAEAKLTREEDPTYKMGNLAYQEAENRKAIRDKPQTRAEIEVKLAHYSPETQKMIFGRMDANHLFDETGQAKTGAMNDWLNTNMVEGGALSVAIAQSETKVYGEAYRDSQETWAKLRDDGKGDTKAGRAAHRDMIEKGALYSSHTKAGAHIVTKDREYAQKLKDDKEKEATAQANRVALEKEKSILRIEEEKAKPPTAVKEIPDQKSARKLFEQNQLTDVDLIRVEENIAEDIENKSNAWIHLYNKHSKTDQYVWTKKGIVKGPVWPDSDGWVKVPKGDIPTTDGEPKVIVRRGTLNGRSVVQYEDGTTAYAD